MNITCKTTRWGMIVGVLLAVIPFFGTVTGRVRMMEALADSDTVDGKALTEAMKQTSWFSGLGAVTGFLGVTLFAVSAVLYYKRSIELRRKE